MTSATVAANGETMSVGGHAALHTQHWRAVASELHTMLGQIEEARALVSSTGRVPSRGSITWLARGAPVSCSDVVTGSDCGCCVRAAYTSTYSITGCISGGKVGNDASLNGLL